jgi:hypothetical protein
MKIQYDEWSSVKYFTMGEFNAPRAGASARYDRMDRDEVYLMDFLRHEMESPFQVTSAWSPGKGHTSKSFHYVGLATDGFWYELDFIEGIDRVTRIIETRTVADVRRMHIFLIGTPGETKLGDLMGFGLYTGGSLKGGGHYDLRGKRSRWGYEGAVDVKGIPVYVSFEEAYGNFVGVAADQK